ncbi:MAG: flagellar export chaperone FliS [Candidatus Competibacteraceae bacterium]|nr:MAG: flagellar export chaperone FliS [Candidatus Competibacteraceae bacterium]
MIAPRASKALRQYQQIDQSAAVYASPHRIIQILMEGVQDRLIAAKVHIQRGQIAGKGEQISKAIGILGGLRENLDHKIGGDLAADLEALYDYMERRLLEANLYSDIAMIDEVADLLRPIKEGWDAIGNSPEANPPPAPVDAPA